MNIHDTIQQCGVTPSEDSITTLLEICDELNTKIEKLESDLSRAKLAVAPGGVCD